MKSFKEIVCVNEGIIDDVLKENQKIISEVAKIIHHGAGNAQTGSTAKLKDTIVDSYNIQIVFEMPKGGFGVDDFLMKQLKQRTKNRFYIMFMSKDSITVMIKRK